MLVAFAVLHGIAWGLRGPFMQAIRADYFGRSAIGMILGLSFMIIVIGQIGGPMIAGILADVTGNYRVGFTVLAVLAGLGSVFFLLAKKPAAAGLSPVGNEPLEASGVSASTTFRRSRKEARRTGRSRPARRGGTTIPGQRDRTGLDRLDFSCELAAHLVRDGVGEKPDAHQQRYLAQRRDARQERETRGRHAQLADGVKEIGGEKPEHRGPRGRRRAVGPGNHEHIPGRERVETEPSLIGWLGLRLARPSADQSRQRPGP